MNGLDLLLVGARPNFEVVWVRLDDASWIHDVRTRMSDVEFGGTNLSGAPKSSRVLQRMAIPSRRGTLRTYER